MLKHEIIDENSLREFSPVALAYIGDAVFELAVRTRVITGSRKKVRELHLETVSMVRAESQAQVLKQLIQELNEKEKDIVRRGRNAKSSPPKNADPAAYQLSTGFEALLGWLYLQGDDKRLQYILDLALSGIAE